MRSSYSLVLSVVLAVTIFPAAAHAGPRGCVQGGGTLYTTGDGSSCWFRCVGGKQNGQWYYDARMTPPTPQIVPPLPQCPAPSILKRQKGPDACVVKDKVVGPPRCHAGKLYVDLTAEGSDLCDTDDGHQPESSNTKKTQ